MPRSLNERPGFISMNEPLKEQTTSDRIERPYHAWLAPIAGYAAAVILNIMMNLTLGKEEPSRVYMLIMGLVPLSGWLAFHVFGYVRSVQCLINKRSPKHGIAGLIVNTLSVAFMVLVFIGTIMAAQSARQIAQQQQQTPPAPARSAPALSTPSRVGSVQLDQDALTEQLPGDAVSAVQSVCDQKRGKLPLALSDHVTLTSVIAARQMCCTTTCRFTASRLMILRR